MSKLFILKITKKVVDIDNLRLQTHFRLWQMGLSPSGQCVPSQAESLVQPAVSPSIRNVSIEATKEKEHVKYITGQVLGKFQVSS
jgi:hypothetical protein